MADEDQAVPAAEAVDDSKADESKADESKADESKASESKDDSKDDEKKSGDSEEKKFKNPFDDRTPKPDPGDGLPKEKPDEIEFKWNKEMLEKKACDTLHMLYLLQCALELVRKRTIERNKYFKSIGRTDRYINQLDNPQIITNFIEWHNEDKEKNKFDGELLETGEKLFMINEMVSAVGKVKKGPATKIYTKLRKDVVIEKATWMDMPQPKLYLETWGKTKMYAGEKVFIECTKEEIITLLTFDAGADFDVDEKTEFGPVQGVLALIEAQTAKKKKPSALVQEKDWKEKVTAYFTQKQMTGELLMKTGVKDLCNECMNAVVPPTELNEKGKPRNLKLRGGVNQVLRTLKGCYVHGILSAAAAQKE